MVKSTLKRCPFCGSLGTYVWDDIDEVWMAGCTNKKCIASIDSLHVGHEWSGSIEAAGKAWNKRVKAGDE